MADFQLNEDSIVPLWVQLKTRLSYLIMTNVYEYGSQLPTVRELSVNLGVAYNTVGKVYRDLERDGLIKTKQGQGTFVVYRPSAENPRIDMILEASVIDLVNMAHNAGMTDDELRALLNYHLERSN